MHLTLGADAERMIQEQMATGAYGSAEEVVLAALHALSQEQAALAPGELDALIDEGEESLRVCGPVPADEAFDRVRQKLESPRSRRP